MTAIARLTRAEVRKLATTRAFLITVAIAVGLAVIAVLVDAAEAGKNQAPALGTANSTYNMLRLGGVCCVAMLIVGIIASGGEYRHKTIISATLITPRRSAQVAAKTIAVAIAAVVLTGLTFGLGLATIVAELHAHGFGQLPPGTTRMVAGSVIAAVLFGVIGVALGYITRSTTTAVVGAVGWVLFVELAILNTLAPQQAKWLISGLAQTLTNPPVPGHPPATAAAVAVLAAYTVALLIAGWQVVLRRDVT
jgi:ABC-2 type transport system permease protein